MKPFPILFVTVIAGLLLACENGTEIDAETTAKASQVLLSSRSIPIISKDQFEFRDLNKNSELDPYEDWRLPPDKRAADLVQRMSLLEKLGQLAHGNVFPNASFGETATGYDLEQAAPLITEQFITTILPFASLSPRTLAEQNNALQEIAETTRLGIPVTVSTDPRHHFFDIFGVSAAGEGYSQWPEPLGLAALNDPVLTQRFGETVAIELRATGFNQLLAPQADLSTEPRWSRIFQTFGEDPEIVSRMVKSFVLGAQGSAEGVVSGHIPAVVKHWVGYGAAKNGFDAHNFYGRFADLDSEDLDTHIRPFLGAFEVEVAGVMPAYSVFEGLTVNGQTVESRGAVYSEILIKDLLRTNFGYEGVILSDWAITNNCTEVCRNGRPEGAYPDPVIEAATGWGVQDISRPARFALAMSVGVDQFGGVNDTAPILEAIQAGLISEDRINESVVRILTKSFRTGIFDNPFVSVEVVGNVVNNDIAAALSHETQSRSIVLLKRDNKEFVPGDSGVKVYVHRFDPEILTTVGLSVTEEIRDADLAIVRLRAPFGTQHPNFFFGMQQNEASLAFDLDGEDLTLLSKLSEAGVRTIVDVALDRPAILTDVVAKADVLTVNFGADDLALMRVLTGEIQAEGRLPFELPSSLETVEAQNSGRPADLANPLFPLGFSANSIR